MRGSKTGSLIGPAGTRPPRTARHSRPTDCQPTPLRVMPAGKRFSQLHNRGFRGPDHPFSVAWLGLRPAVRDAKALGPMPSPLSTFSESLQRK